jgi:hypothetical protein
MELSNNSLGLDMPTNQRRLRLSVIGFANTSRKSRYAQEDCHIQHPYYFHN